MDDKNVYISQRTVFCKVVDLETIANKTLTLPSPFISALMVFLNVKRIMTKGIYEIHRENKLYKRKFSYYLCCDSMISNRIMNDSF